MNIKKITEELERRYPSKKIVLNTPKQTIEIICEVGWKPEVSFAAC